MGNVQEALKTSTLTYEFPWFRTDLAKALAAQNIDPTFIFDKIYSKHNDGGSESVRRVRQAPADFTWGVC